MAWRDRARRNKRAVGPETPAAPRPEPDSGPVPVAGPDERGSAVPGGWDGGGRHAGAPRLTVPRAPLAVSDGMVFRAGLAAWRDPSFDTGLAHGVLPSAPAGLVSGVTRPATGTARAGQSAGGPLLLRALAQEGED